MYKVRTKRKRSKTMVILMLPALIFIGFLGWLMYAMGSRKVSTAPVKKASNKKAKAPTPNDGVSFVPVNLEEQEIISE